MNYETSKTDKLKTDRLDTDKLDVILANEQELVPSSGFLARVMDKVREEAEAPQPIPFPWKRAIPGMALASGVLGWGAWEMARYALSSPAHLALRAIHISGSGANSAQQAGWVVAGLACSAAAWLLSRRLAGRSGLL